MLLYYITDRRQFPGDDAAQRRALLAKIAEAARCGVDFIQLREKDLSSRELEILANEAMAIVRSSSVHSKLETRHSKLLINSRADIALAAGTDGVHLPASDLSASEVRSVWDAATRNVKRETRNATIAVSCHTLDEVLAAESHGADFVVFGPVFEKVGTAAAGVAQPPSAGRIHVAQPPSAVRPGVGLAALREVCRRGLPPDPQTESVASGRMPVLALGGVTLENARVCLAAGATGIAGIRLFQNIEVREVVKTLYAAGDA